MAWTFEESAEVAASAEEAFAAWTDVELLARASDVESMSLDGPFEVGSRLVLKAHGLPTARLKITHVQPPRRWTDEGVRPGFRMVVDHFVDPVEGGVRLTERMEIRGLLSPVISRVMGPKLRAAARATVDHVAAQLAGPLAAEHEAPVEQHR